MPVSFDMADAPQIPRVPRFQDPIMPHAKLVEHSTAMARAVGDSYAELHKVRSAGVSAQGMVAIGTLEGALARVSECNAAMGTIAQGLSDEAPADAKDAGGKTAKASS